MLSFLKNYPLFSIVHNGWYIPAWVMYAGWMYAGMQCFMILQIIHASYVCTESILISLLFYCKMNWSFLTAACHRGIFYNSKCHRDISSFLMLLATFSICNQRVSMSKVSCILRFCHCIWRKTFRLYAKQYMCKIAFSPWLLHSHKFWVFEKDF